MVVSVGSKTSCRHSKQNTPKRRIFSCVLKNQLLARMHSKKTKSSFSRLASGQSRTSFLPSGSMEVFNLNAKSSKCDDALVLSVLNYPFKNMCRLLQELDLDEDYDLIAETVLHFSLKIYGLPECHCEDLPLAVYFFIEDTFGIQSKTELCVKLHEDGDPSVIGVVFENIHMKYHILKKNSLLEGAEVQVKDNEDLGWITRALCSS